MRRSWCSRTHPEVWGTVAFFGGLDACIQGIDASAGIAPQHGNRASKWGNALASLSRSQPQRRRFASATGPAFRASGLKALSQRIRSSRGQSRSLIGTFWAIFTRHGPSACAAPSDDGHGEIISSGRMASLFEMARPPLLMSPVGGPQRRGWRFVGLRRCGRLTWQATTQPELLTSL